MDLKLADDVRIIVEEGSVSDAAKRLNISQPALSARMKKLEEAYGICLFKSNKRPATLTGEGKLFLEYAAQVRDMDRQFRRILAENEQQLSGGLAIGGTHLFTGRFLPPAVKAFNRRYPEVSITIVNEKVPELTAMAAKEKLDLFITSTGKKAQGIVYEPLFRVKMYFCVPREYSVNHEFETSGFDLEKLEGYPFILLGESQYMGAVMRKLLRRHGVNPQQVIYTDQANTAYDLSKAGVGISLMYARLAEQVRDAEGPCMYTTDDEEMESEISVAYSQHVPLSPAARAFVEILKES